MPFAQGKITRVPLTHGSLLLAVTLLFSPAIATAFPFIAQQWRGVYEAPTGPCAAPSQSMQNVETVNGSPCQMCHRDAAGGVPWNAYGWELRQNGSDFQAAEALNSDGDSQGTSNLQEICANTQPGWNADGTNLAFFRDGSTQATTAPAVAGDLDPAGNLAPTADAGPDRNVEVGTTVNLDGSGSSDPEGNPLSYSWVLTVPGGSSASLQNSTSVNPSFVADVEGNFLVELVVNDGSQDSAPASAVIIAQVSGGNAPPVANAGGNQSVAPGAVVQLDGSASSDADGDPLSYSWTLTTPAGSTAVLSDSATVDPSFTADLEGSYTATLVVNDGTEDSLPDSAVITARTVISIDDPIPGPIQQSRIEVSVVPIARGLTAPNWGTHAPGLPQHLFVSDQPGQLLAVHLPSGTTSVFLDASVLLSTLQPNNGLGARTFLPFDERGLLGIAFHPSFATTGLFYTYTSEAASAPADFPLQADLSPEVQAQFDAELITYPNHQSVIREWVANDPGNPDAGVGPASRVLMRIDQPQFNHNAGALAMDNDGMLLIALGDGGGADDSPEPDMQGFVGVPILGHGEVGNGQNPATVLGSILRINPRGRNSRNGQYGVPVDNPFAGAGDSAGGQVGCADGFCDEIFAYGFRNPFRMSVDSRTGLILTGDVGQNDIEEVDVVVAGGNYGWKLKEGTFFFDPDGPNSGFVTQNAPGTPPGLIDPIAQYDHDEGVSVIGGYVDRGGNVPRLRGRYLFGDYTRPPFDAGNVVCDGRLFVLKDRLRENRRGQLRPINRDAPGDAFVELQVVPPLDRCLLGFAQDASGEVYLLTNTTGIGEGDTGEVLRLVRP